MSGLKPEELLGTVTCADGTRLSIRIAGDGATLVAINGERHAMKRATVVELNRMLNAAVNHAPHRGVGSGR